ncbi:MAG: hypothetical protein M3439_10765 [Chloroflexota bacterium]|nr:hypothetical protein [Chloroflexota bacterium]
MMERSNPATLISIWQQHRDRILGYGHVLHGLLPACDPPVTLHGRDLRPGDEGVGYHFQYTLTGDVYNGTVVSACFAVQIELVEARIVSIEVDAVPLLEYRDGHYDVIGRHGTRMRVGDTRMLWRHFAYSLTCPATDFFTRVRTGAPMDDRIDGFAGPVPTP